jgi:NADPH:quinone reductase-like Zn-dependent oxidoreductase
MKAIRTHEPTGISGLVYEEVPDAKPMTCDVLVKVAACGITHNELDWPLRTCRNGHRRDPIIPAQEVSGVVTALGMGTAGIAVGDEVFGLTDPYRDAAAAEYVAVEARNVAAKPQTADHVHAAAVPRAGLTAWQALFDHGGLAAGQTALIHGAGGGVGVCAVQLARAAGAAVIGTGRAWARELVGELGAERFVDLERERFEAVVGPVDLVFDLVGGDVLERSWSVLKPGGVLVSVVQDPGASALARRADARSIFFVVEADRAELVELARRIDAGQLRPIVGDVLPLARGRDAFQRKHGRGSPGKTVLQVDEARVESH